MAGDLLGGPDGCRDPLYPETGGIQDCRYKEESTGAASRAEKVQKSNKRTCQRQAYLEPPGPFLWRPGGGEGGTWLSGTLTNSEFVAENIEY